MSTRKAETVPYGTLDILILKTLDTMGPLHGYSLARRIEQVSEDLLRLSQGSVYPALIRLEQQGWIRHRVGRLGHEPQGEGLRADRDRAPSSSTSPSPTGNGPTRWSRASSRPRHELSAAPSIASSRSAAPSGSTPSSTARSPPTSSWPNATCRRRPVAGRGAAHGAPALRRRRADQGGAPRQPQRPLDRGVVARPAARPARAAARARLLRRRRPDPRPQHRRQHHDVQRGARDPPAAARLCRSRSAGGGAARRPLPRRAGELPRLARPDPIVRGDGRGRDVVARTSGSRPAPSASRACASRRRRCGCSASRRCTAACWRPASAEATELHTVVISHGLWQQRFGGAADVVGRPLRLDGESYTIVGVMPPRFVFAPFWATESELWAPLPLDAPARQPRRQQPAHLRPAQAGRRRRRGPGRRRSGDRAPGADVPGHQPRRPGGAAEGAGRRPHAPRPVGAARRRRLRPADRLRQRRAHAAGARRGAAVRDRRAPGARRDALPDRPPAADRKPAARRAEQPRRPGHRRRRRPRHRGDGAAGSAARRRHGDRGLDAGVHARPHDPDRRGLRPRAGVAGGPDADRRSPRPRAASPATAAKRSCAICSSSRSWPSRWCC